MVIFQFWYIIFVVNVFENENVWSLYFIIWEDNFSLVMEEKWILSQYVVGLSQLNLDIQLYDLVGFY